MEVQVKATWFIIIRFGKCHRSRLKKPFLMGRRIWNFCHQPAILVLEENKKCGWICNISSLDHEVRMDGGAEVIWYGRENIYIFLSRWVHPDQSYNVICMHVFRADHLVLDNHQLVCPFLEKTISSSRCSSLCRLKAFWAVS